MPFAILPVLQWFGAGFWAFASSRVGQIIIAAAVAWLWSGWRADDHWKAVIAADKAQVEAAYRAEVARQERAAQEIAAAATARAADDAALERELRTQIEAFNAKESQNATPPRTVKQIIFREPAGAMAPHPCLIDGVFADRVRQFDAAARRPTKPSRRAR